LHRRYRQGKNAEGLLHDAVAVAALVLLMVAAAFLSGLVGMAGQAF
jgi:hypothetical protein